MRVVGGEEEALGAEEVDGFGKLRLFGLDGEGKVIFEVMARRLFIFFQELACRQDRARPAKLLAGFRQIAVAQRRFFLIVIIHWRRF